MRSRIPSQKLFSLLPDAFLCAVPKCMFCFRLQTCCVLEYFCRRFDCWTKLCRTTPVLT